jgi:hypothetical protein
MGRRKYVAQFRRPRWPTKIVLFSSVADENAFIFVDFIPSAYFRRPTDENTYFRRFLGYFRWFVADEITLFSCSVPSGHRCRPTPQLLLTLELAGLKLKPRLLLKSGMRPRKY